MPSSWKTDEYLEHFKYMYLSETFDHARNFNDCIELIQTLPEVTFETVVALIEKGNHHRSDCVISILALMDDIEAIEFLIDLFELDLQYERANNCMNKHGGLLTGAGIFMLIAVCSCSHA